MIGEFPYLSITENWYVLVCISILWSFTVWALSQEAIKTIISIGHKKNKSHKHRFLSLWAHSSKSGSLGIKITGSFAGKC